MLKRIVKIIRKGKFNVTLIYKDLWVTVRGTVSVSQLHGCFVDIAERALLPPLYDYSQLYGCFMYKADPIPALYDYSQAEVDEFRACLSGCVWKYKVRTRGRFNVNEVIDDLMAQYWIPDTSGRSVFQKWLARYKGFEKGSGSTGYLYVCVRGYIFGFVYGYRVKKTEIPESKLVDYNDCCCHNVSEYEDRSSLVVDAILRYKFSRPEVECMTDDQRHMLIRIVFSRWASVRDDKKPVPVSEFEAAYMGLTIEQAENAVDGLVSACEKDKEDIAKLVHLGFPAEKILKRANS